MYMYSDPHLQQEPVIAIMKETVITLHLILQLFGYVKVQCGNHTGNWHIAS